MSRATRMKSLIILSVLLRLGCSGFSEQARVDDNAALVKHNITKLYIPTLNTDNKTIDKAFRVAVGDLVGNIMLFKGGLLETPTPVILAGLDYNRPWTRDASINSWNGTSLLMPEISRNTLVSVLSDCDDKIRIGGQYWVAIVWASGAWWHYLYTGDKK